MEQAFLLAEAAGRYSLRIKAQRKLAVPGRYRLSVTAPRSAISQDHDRIAAQARQYDIGELDRRKADVPSWERAVVAYQAALATWRALAQPPPLSLAEIQHQVLDLDTLLLEYALGPQHSYLWAVTRGTLASFVLPKRALLEAQAKRVYDLLTVRTSKQQHETKEQWQARAFAADRRLPVEAAKLSQMLLGPVAAQLGRKRLLIVADGALQYIPFAALPVPESGSAGAGEKRRKGKTLPLSPAFPLIVTHEIINLPSASTLAVLRRELAGRARAPVGGCFGQSGLHQIRCAFDTSTGANASRSQINRPVVRAA